jgi:CBS-domain-containing membrane protein
MSDGPAMLREPPVLAYRAAGSASAIAFMKWLPTCPGEPLSRVPFVASIVLVMMLPRSEAAQPFAVLTGCILLVAFVQAWRWGERALFSRHKDREA